MNDTAGGICEHRCPEHPDWTPCQLAPGHSTVIGHQDHGHGGDPAAEHTSAALRAAARAFGG
jgi:hypothetical protein